MRRLELSSNIFVKDRQFNPIVDKSRHYVYNYLYMLEGLGPVRPSEEDIKLLGAYPLLGTYLQSFEEPYYSNPERWMEDLDTATQPLRNRLAIASGWRTLEAVKYQAYCNLAFLNVLNPDCPEFMHLDNAEYLALIGYEVKPFRRISPFKAAILKIFTQEPYLKRRLTFEQFGPVSAIVSATLSVGTILRLLAEGETDEDNLQVFKKFINREDFGQA